jgi:hypothetical protein
MWNLLKSRKLTTNLPKIANLMRLDRDSKVKRGDLEIRFRVRHAVKSICFESAV